ncbi:MAG: hypothetical protein BAJALOKI2v1_220001, partial [Promethearchaeota archaeon]
MQVDSFLDTGEYEIRADFNGTWTSLPQIYPNINASSNYQDFNITEEITYSLHFYVNSTSTNYPYTPNNDNLFRVQRGEFVNLSVLLINDIDGTPVPSETVEFYNYSNSITSLIG